MSSGESGASSGSISAARAVRDISKELRGLLKSPPEGIRLLLSGDDVECISSVLAELDGPVGTPYEGGVFKMKLEFGSEFPTQPPKGYFLTRIFHPNIAKNGEICVNTLKRDWKPTLGLRHVLIVVRCLLIEPYPESALNEEAGKLLLDDYAEYAHHAKLMTSIHALPKVPRVAAGAAPTEQQREQNDTLSAKDSASRGSSGSPGDTAGSTPFALNSSIANSDTDRSDSASEKPKIVDTGRGMDGALESLSSSQKGNVMSSQVKDKAEKKKAVDNRKKALKRL